MTDWYSQEILENPYFQKNFMIRLGGHSVVFCTYKQIAGYVYWVNIRERGIELFDVITSS